MRVLFLDHKEIFGGGQVVLLNVVGEWQKWQDAPQVCVICSPRAALAPRVRALNVPCETFELGEVDKARGLGWNLAQRVRPTLRLLQSIRKFRPDVVCANGAYSFLACALAAEIARLPLVWWEHNNKPLPDSRILRWLIHRADFIVSVSHMFHTQVLALEPRAQFKSSVIYNGVDSEKFRKDAPARDRTRLALHVADDTRVIGTVCRLSHEKGLDVLLDAAVRLCQTFPKVEFLIVGAGPQRAELEQRASSHQIADRVHFTGLRDDIPDLLNAMDIFVLPSLAESFGLAVVEAMASQLPVVASDIEGVREVVVQGETGLLVAAQDTDALITALADLLHDQDKCLRLGEKGRARMLDQFTLAEQARQFQILLEKTWKAS